MTGWIILVIWTLCGLIAWRPTLRFFNGEMEPDEWIWLVCNVGFATFFGFAFGPGILLCVAFNATIGQRVDPESFARRLEGAPREKQLEARLRQLENRNAQLERELGL